MSGGYELNKHMFERFMIEKYYCVQKTDKGSKNIVCVYSTHSLIYLRFSNESSDGKLVEKKCHFNFLIDSAVSNS